MRTENEVMEKCKEQYHKELRGRIKKYTSKSFLNCKFNERHRVRNNGTTGFCSNPIKKKECKTFVYVCDSDEISKECKLFKCMNTTEKVKEEFESIVKDPSRCGQEYPKLATLLWVYQNGDSYQPGRLKRFLLSIYKVINFSWW
jgi:hypothetical protein